MYLFDVITLPFFYFTFLVTCFLTFLMFMFGEVSNAKIVNIESQGGPIILSQVN
jgi:hypothetical protein